MNTGFLFDDNGILVNYGFYALLVIVFAAVLLLSLLDKRRGGAYFTNEVSGFVDGKAVMLGFPLLIAGALAIYEGYTQTKSILPAGFLIFVDILFGGVMVILAFVILYKKEVKPWLGFSLIVPALYYTLRGIAVFLKHMAVTTIPEYLIEGIGVIGFAVFFMQLAKYLTGNATRTTRPLLSAVGITTAVMTLANAASVIIADIADPYNVSVRIVADRVTAELMEQQKRSAGVYGYHMAYASWVDVVMAVCVILTLIALYKKNKITIDTTIEVDEEQSSEIVVVCPYCGSTDTDKISNISKATATALFGVHALAKNTKQWHCNKCNSDF